MSRVIGHLPPLGDVESGILLAAEQRAVDVGRWIPRESAETEPVRLDVKVITIYELEKLLRRSTVLRGQGRTTEVDA